ncbi:MAG: sulfatase [Acidobacteria bacterium]|nr:sulfatase [Acidobacteriota bacterium]
MSSTKNHSGNNRVDAGISRRDILKLGAGTLGGALLTVASPSAVDAQQSSGTGTRKPNFVIFMGDGIQHTELSVAGNLIIQTPNIDRIAREGLRFRNAFVINALCAPSRATILTGLYSRRNGVIDNKQRPIGTGIPIVSDYLRKAGYEVAFCGKSHVAGGLRNYYWDYYYGYLGQKPYVNAPIAEGVDGHIGRDRVAHGYSDDVITMAAADWLEGKREKPFCLYLWLKAPHEPFIPPRNLALLYDDGTKIPVPETFNEDLKGYPGKPRAFAACDNHIGTDSTGVTTLEALVKQRYASTVGLDQNVGRILKVLERTGKLDETVVMFTSDHGYFLGEWHFMDKRLMHEPSIRIPLLMRYPKMIKAGSLNDDMVLNLDLAPTMLDLAGVKVPDSMQGRSIVPFLNGGKPASWRKDWYYAFYEYPGANMVPKNRGVRTERYKLIEYWEFDPKEYELYDLQEDPKELHNLYGEPKYKELAEHLRHRMMELGRETGEI